MKVERTTFEVEGVNEPCILVSDGYTEVRISKCHHIIGRDSLYLAEFLDGDFNGMDEWNGDFDDLRDKDAIRLAKAYSVYLQ